MMMLLFLVKKTQTGFTFGCVDLKSTKIITHGIIKYACDTANDVHSFRTLLATCMLHMLQHQTTHCNCTYN